MIVDQTCQDIALHLKEQINEVLASVYQAKAIRTIRDFNDENVALTDYPVLKVYRLEDNYRTHSHHVFSVIRVEYAQVLDRAYRGVPFLSLIGKLIHTFLQNLIDQRDVVVSSKTAPKGILTITEGVEKTPIGIYQYECGIEDATLPQEILAKLLQ